MTAKLPNMQGKVVRRIELKTGESAADEKVCLVLVTEIAPNFHHVYLLAGIGKKMQGGAEKTRTIVSKAVAMKIADDLRDDQLRKGFTLSLDWSLSKAREILPAPMPMHKVRMTAAELPASSQAALAVLF